MRVAAPRCYTPPILSSGARKDQSYANAFSHEDLYAGTLRINGDRSGRAIVITASCPGQLRPGTGPAGVPDDRQEPELQRREGVTCGAPHSSVYVPRGR